MNIEIIIPNYNGSGLIRKNLPKIIESIQSEKNIKIVIVDDGSTQLEQERLKKITGLLQLQSNIEIKLMLFQNNVGFSSNINRAALTSKSDFIVLLNSDVIPEKNFLQPLYPHFHNENVFGVGMLDKSLENGKVVLRGSGKTYWKKGMFFHREGEIFGNKTDWISGGSCMVRTRLFKKLKGFDFLYNPFYWEDIDLSYRARKSGYAVFFEPKSIVVHKHSEGAIKKNFVNSWVKTISYRNQLIFIWKNITDRNLIFSHIFFLPIYISSAIFRRNTQFLHGFLLAILLLPAIISHRIRTKKQFILKDINIIEFIK